MLKLCGITKDYLSGDDRVSALRGIDLSFRKNEFVSVLGPSGCGKTTLLNLIGGLDRYTEGDLVINGKSTKQFSPIDWDAYRNHSVGFVFQNYNLIPHQSVLANVELALTLSGVSKSERRNRARKALERVGLKDQMKKRPNQLSGGQMQRVAIARALVNDPEILLADEPTGALDSVTSVQIMDLLKEVAQDRLVIMVTHNPALAETYSTRIIKLLDGKVVDDSMPYDDRDEKEKSADVKVKRPSMSFFTALSLSLHNLMTKKGRTLLTAFAGSIGIIGIALILSLSNGINQYIEQVQEDTLSSYPIIIQAESIDLSGVLTTLMGIRRGEAGEAHELDAVYSSSVMGELVNSLNSAGVNTNDTKAFRDYLEKDTEGIGSHISDVHYSYNVDLNIYTEDGDGLRRRSDVNTMMKDVFREAGIPSEAFGARDEGANFSRLRLWEEMLPGEDGALINSLIPGQYDLLAGKWPERYDQVVLIVDKNNEVSDMMLGALGFKTMSELADQLKTTSQGEQIDIQYRAFSYEDVLSRSFRLFLTPELYQKNLEQGYTLLTETENGLNYLFNSDRGITLTISGVIRQKEDATAGMLNGTMGYTAALTEYILTETKKQEMVQAQFDHPETDVVLGLPFRTENDPVPGEEDKPGLITDWAKDADPSQKSAMYLSLMTQASDEYVAAAIDQTIGGLDRAGLEQLVVGYITASEKEGTDTGYILSYVAEMSDEDLRKAVTDGLAEQIRQQYTREATRRFSAYSEIQLAAAFDAALAQSTFSASQLVTLYDNYMPALFSESNQKDVLKRIGYLDQEKPDAIYIYANTFNDKDAISDCIAAYNEGKSEADQITYTDYVALLMSSISTIINAISYVLVAFVAISLVVSSIMIGIITYISVLERTKEIGILRSIGASRRDIARVFNAETLIEGFVAGLIGIGFTLILIIPINAIIRSLSGISTIGAALPAIGAVILVVISMALTYLAGLIPSGVAARRDPVVALRSE